MEPFSFSRGIGRVWRSTPAVIAFALLAVQAALPWTVHRFVTEDGPSHVYGATILRDLVAHRAASVYSSVYAIQWKALPNWASTVVLAAAQPIAGLRHAEPLFVSLALAIGFLGMAYAGRALSPEASPWTPVSNFLCQSWFLYLGFYNLYLGMVLLPFLIGYYVRHAGRLDGRRAAAIALGLVALFFTHLIPAAIAAIALLTMALWTSVGRPRQFALLASATVPALLLMGVYALSSTSPVRFDSQMAWAWRSFPMHVFLTGAGRWGAQAWLWPVMLTYILAGVLFMTREEWRSAKGGLALATAAVFAAYLVLPDRGLGGTEVKIRLAWGVFVLGGLLAPSVQRLRVLRTPIALFVGCLLALNLTASARSLRSVSRAADEYLAVARQIAPGASVVRLRYATPDVPARFGYQGIGRDPLFHLEALAAVERGGFDWSDYEAISRIFPVAYNSRVDGGLQSGLWSFEGPDAKSAQMLEWLSGNLPAPIDFVLVLGDEHSAEAVAQGLPAMLRYLDANMARVAASGTPMIRLYRRSDFAPAAPRVRVPVSTVQMNDAGAAWQLSGFYGTEADAWRWTARRFAVELALPPGASAKGATLRMALTIPGIVTEKLGKVTLSATAGGATLPPETFDTSGPRVFSRDIPAGVLHGAPVRVDFQLDKALPPTGADGRELGIIVSRVEIR